MWTEAVREEGYGLEIYPHHLQIKTRGWGLERKYEKRDRGSCLFFEVKLNQICFNASKVRQGVNCFQVNKKCVLFWHDSMMRSV